MIRQALVPVSHCETTALESGVCDSQDVMMPAPTTIMTACLRQLLRRRGIPIPGTRVSGNQVHRLDLIAGWVPVDGPLDLQSSMSLVPNTHGDRPLVPGHKTLR